MGRGQGRKRHFKGDNSRQEGGRDAKSRDRFLTPAELQSPAFEEYYKGQDVVPEGEWEQFVASLNTPLPITFRINGSGSFANELRNYLETDFFSRFSKEPIVLDGEVVDPPRPLPWYPNKLAWHMNFSRNQLRKLSWLEAIHEFMKAANDAGSITRQEAVSMVPPLFMDVQPHHKVLDMCAAPGSKTFQLLEMLHDLDSSGSSGSEPTGFVVANDADPTRCNLLVHQTKRMCSPCLMVTNHEAQQFPRISASALARPAPGSAAAAEAAAAAALQPDAAGSSGDVAGGAAGGRVPSRGDTMLFDRILCDVPCSGDGTIRKAPDIWRRWAVNSGNGLHTLQLRIALQAARLLQVGGRMVYSTCTFNPIEDEAVVAELLVRCKGALQLVDVSQQLPELKRLPGKRKWRVRDKSRWYDTWEEAEKVGFKLEATMFSNEEKQQLPMERSMRILPHQQDTGGFFIAVLEKVAPTPTRLEVSANQRPAQRSAPNSRHGQPTQTDGAEPVEATDAEAAASKQEQGAKANKSQRQQKPKQAQPPQQQEQQQHNDQQATAQQAQAGAAAADAPEPPAAATAAAAAAAGDAGGAEDDLDALYEQTDNQKTADGASGAAGGAGGPAQQIQPSWVRGSGGRGRAGGGGRFKGVDPIFPMEDPKILQMLVDFFGVEAGFPLTTHLIMRSIESALPKRLYYVSDALLSLLLADEREVLKIISTGLKLFERQEMKGKQTSKCSYRIAQEGLPFLLPHVTKQLVRLGVDDFLRLLKERNVPLPLAAGARAVDAAVGDAAAGDAAVGDAAAGDAAAGEAGVAAAASADAAPSSEQQHKPASGQAPLDTPEVLQQLESVQFGGAVAVLEESVAAELGLATQEASGALTVNAPLAISVWRTPASLSVFVAKTECEQLVEKVTKAVQRSQQQKQQQEAAAVGQPGAAAEAMVVG